MKDCPFKKNLTAGDGTRCKETGYFCTWQYESICKVKEKYMHQTNADRIRAMTDEELAELFYSLHNLEDKVKFCKNKSECDDILDSGKVIPDNMCKKCLVEWLREEVE